MASAAGTTESNGKDTSMKARAAVLMIAMAALVPATASATPVAQLTSPTTECVGNIWPVKGTATWDSTKVGSVDWTLKRGDTGAILTSQHRTNQSSAGQITTFDTNGLPTGTTFLEELTVHEAGSADAFAQRTFTWTFDRTPPQAPAVSRVYATAPRQVWAQVDNSYDLGCAAGVGGYHLVAYLNGTGSPIELNGFVDQNGVVNGAAHEVLGAPALAPGNRYLIGAIAADTVGNQSQSGTGITVDTPATNDSTVAGQVRGSGAPLQGVRVTATGSGGQLVNQTDATGWYTLGLDYLTSHSIAYVPCGCIPNGADAFAPATGSVPAQVEPGRIVVRHKQMTLAP